MVKLYGKIDSLKHHIWAVNKFNYVNIDRYEDENKAIEYCDDGKYAVDYYYLFIKCIFALQT